MAAAPARDSTPTLLIDLDPQTHPTTIHGQTPAEAHHSIVPLYQDELPLEELAAVREGVGRQVPAHAELIKVDSIFGKGPAFFNRVNSGLQTLDASGGENEVSVEANVSPLDVKRSGRN